MRSGCATTSGAATRPSRSSSSASARRPGCAAWIATRGKSGAYLSLKLRLPATRVAPLAVVSAPVPLRRRRAKSLSSDARQREPGLKIAGRGFEGEKHGGGEGRELIGLQIVELDEGDAWPVRAHDEIALPAGRHRASRAGCASVRPVTRCAETVPCRRRRWSRSHRSVQRRRWRTASSIARASVCPVLAPLSPMPRPCFITVLKLLLSWPVRKAREAGNRGWVRASWRAPRFFAVEGHQCMCCQGK